VNVELHGYHAELYEGRAWCCRRRG